ncbi:MAG TPA: isoprenylcysteine carboxylmethyltransferase family protein [Bryobacteraceae bacterium]
MSFPKPYADAVAKLRVPCGFLLAGAFLWFSNPSPASMAIGLPISALGLAVRAWAAGHLEKNLTLARSGPYARVRNPLYIGTLTVAAGLAVAAREWTLGLLFAAVFLLVYLPVVELEEQHLRRLFPDFEQYARAVPRLVPRFGRAPIGKTFRWSLYRRNREYEALAGLLAGTVVLVWKALRSL